MTDIAIDELWVYPVKSLGGVQLTESELTPSGSLDGDREWLVVDPDGQMIWQGDIPRMTLVRVSLRENILQLELDGFEPLRVDRSADGTSAPVEMYKRHFTGIDMGSLAADWLSDALGQPLRLVRIGDAAHLWDGLNPVHVTTDISLQVLNDELRLQGNGPVSHQRFRPNVVLRTVGLEPWFEERTAVIDFGASRLVFREPCQRCELPNISLVDARREKQPLKLIGQLARNRASAAPASFGIYASAEGARLEVGMRANLDALPT